MPLNWSVLRGVGTYWTNETLAGQTRRGAGPNQYLSAKQWKIFHVPDTLYFPSHMARISLVQDRTGKQFRVLSLGDTSAMWYSYNRSSAMLKYLLLLREPLALGIVRGSPGLWFLKKTGNLNRKVHEDFTWKYLLSKTGHVNVCE